MKLSKHPETIKVKILRESLPCWYNIGEEHEVLNHITFSFRDGAHFERSPHSKGIKVSDCEILIPEPEIPEYTIKELIEKVGHEFKIKDD